VDGNWIVAGASLLVRELTMRNIPAKYSSTPSIPGGEARIYPPMTAPTPQTNVSTGLENSATLCRKEAFGATLTDPAPPLFSALAEEHELLVLLPALGSEPGTCMIISR
jgi:hypothetical protein